MHTVLKMPRLALRQFTRDGAGNLFDLNSDLGEFLPWFHFRSSSGTDITNIDLGVQRCSRVGSRQHRIPARPGEMRPGATAYHPVPGPDVMEGAKHGEADYALTKPEWEARTAGDDCS